MDELAIKRKAERDFRREQHLCTVCGEPLPEGYKFMRCEGCRMYERAAYKMHKDKGVCVKCGKEDAYTMVGRALCAECDEIRSVKGKINREKDVESYRTHDKIRAKKRYHDLKTAHRCIVCGKALPSWWNHVRCPEHHRHVRDWSRNDRRSRGIISHTEALEQGKCFLCMKKPAANGKKMCEECYKKSCERLAIARASIDNTKHIWCGMECVRIAEIKIKYGNKKKQSDQEQEES